MKKFNGFEEAKKAADSQGFAKLPAGGYICKVMNVKAESLDWGDRIIIQFDIEEGEYKSFFKKQYDANTSEDKKWKGVARIVCPSDDGSDQDNKTKNRFANWIRGFEKSNPGYEWDWDENKWKGLNIGILFRPVGNVINNKEVLYTEASIGCSVEDIQKGTYWDGWTKLIKKNGYTGNGSEPKTDDDGFMKIPDDATEEEIPF